MKWRDVKNYFLSLSTKKAAMAVGIAFISSVVVVTVIDDFLLANFVVPGDTEQLDKDIASNPKRFGVALVAYFFVLLLDSIIGLALYIVLRFSNKSLALLTAILRLLYAVILAFGLFALAFQTIDTYLYAEIKLLGYVSFALHIFFLAYSILRSDYMPNSLGLLLLLASLTYITFFVDLDLPESFMIFIMLIMAIAELSLSVWLIINRNQLPESIRYIRTKNEKNK